MKLIGKDGLSRFLEIALWVLMAIVVVLLLALPWSITRITGRIPGDPYYIKYLVILAYSGVMAELVLWQCRGMVRNINAGKVFTADTVRRLRVAAVVLRRHHVLDVQILYGLSVHCLCAGRLSAAGAGGGIPPGQSVQGRE